MKAKLSDVEFGTIVYYFMSYSRNKNYQKAKEYFNLQPNEVLHHIDPSWKTDDLERYEQWNIEDLVKMTRSEHQSLHMKLNNPKRGGNKGEDNPMYGKHHSEESKNKMRKPHGVKTRGNSGMHWYTDGENNIQAYECPEGYKKGRVLIPR